jgi:hypothetical protein
LIIAGTQTQSYLSLLLLGDHESFQMGSVDKSIFNYEFRVGIVNFRAGEFVSKCAQGVSEPVIFFGRK